MRILTVLTVLALLAGCAGAPKKEAPKPPYRSDPNHSKALNILMAADYVGDPAKAPVKDVPWEKLETAFSEPGTRLTGVGDLAVHGGFAVMNLLNPAAGFTALAALPFSVLALLTSDVGASTHPLARPLDFGWYPKDPQEPLLEGHRRIENLWNRAFFDAVLEVAPEHGYRTELRDRETIAVKKRFSGYKQHTFEAENIIHIEGGGCWRENINCYFVPIEYYNRIQKLYGQEKHFTAPAFLGGQTARRWHYHSLVKQLQEKIQDPAFPIFEVLRAASARLPEGLYLYLPPDSVPLGGDQGRLKMPVVLDQGKILYFVQPPPDDRRTVSNPSTAPVPATTVSDH